MTTMSRVSLVLDVEHEDQAELNDMLDRVSNLAEGIMLKDDIDIANGGIAVRAVLGVSLHV